MPLRIWLGIVLSLLALALLIGSGILAFAVYALIMTLVLSRLLVHFTLRRISVKRELSLLEANIGEQLNVITKVTNASAVPVLWASVEESVPKDMPVEGKRADLITLLAGKSRTFLYKLTLSRRGYHRIGPLTAEAVDPFGFSRLFRRIPPADYVTVYPKILPLGKFTLPILRPSGEIRITHRAYEDPSRIRGIREYKAGDPLRRVHWRASAKLGELQTKIYDPAAVSGMTLALDFNRYSYARDPSLAGLQGAFERSELAVTLAASLAYDSLEQRQKVGLLTNGVDAAERVKAESQERDFRRRRDVEAEEERAFAGPIHLRASSSSVQGLKIIRTLARLEQPDKPALEEVLFDEAGHIARDTALVVVAPQVDRVLAGRLAGFHHAGMMVYVFLVSPYEEDMRYAREELGQYRIPVRQIASEEDIGELARGALLRV